VNFTLQVYELARDEGGFGMEITKGGRIVATVAGSPAAAAGVPMSRDEAGGKIHRVGLDLGPTLRLSNMNFQSNFWANLRILD
jgi:hypothetical protein